MPPIDAPAIRKIAAKAQTLASHSWEYGAVSHALLETYDPDLSPFFGSTLTVDDIVKEKISQAEGLAYAKKFICVDQSTLIDGEGTQLPKLKYTDFETVYSTTSMTRLSS